MDIRKVLGVTLLIGMMFLLFKTSDANAGVITGIVNSEKVESCSLSEYAVTLEADTISVYHGDELKKTVTQQYGGATSVLCLRTLYRDTHEIYEIYTIEDGQVVKYYYYPWFFDALAYYDTVFNNRNNSGFLALGDLFTSQIQSLHVQPRSPLYFEAERENGSRVFVKFSQRENEVIWHHELNGANLVGIEALSRNIVIAINGNRTHPFASKLQMLERNTGRLIIDTEVRRITSGISNCSRVHYSIHVRTRLCVPHKRYSDGDYSIAVYRTKNITTTYAEFHLTRGFDLGRELHNYKTRGHKSAAITHDELNHNVDILWTGEIHPLSHRWGISNEEIHRSICNVNDVALLRRGYYKVLAAQTLAECSIE